MTDPSERRRKGFHIVFIVACLLCPLVSAWAQQAGSPSSSAGGDPPMPRTVAESSDFKATSNSRQVRRFLRRLAGHSTLLNEIHFGRTIEGRNLTAVTVANPPVSQPVDFSKDERVVVLILGNIHSGECAGKEALLALLRDIAYDASAAGDWLENLILLAVPNFNADGNDRLSTDHRPNQVGPEQGKGVRENAQSLDLNRDFMKLETPEVRALVRLANQWRPSVFIDLHTTNGSLHRYDLAFDFPHNPATPESIQSFLRDDFLPEVQKRMSEQDGVESFFYGNFGEDRQVWETFGHRPRYSTEYFGVRGALAILSEAYAYVPYQRRVEATSHFVRQCLNLASEHSQAIREMTEPVRLPSRSADSASSESVSIAAELETSGSETMIRAYEETGEEERRDFDALTPKDFNVTLLHRYRSVRSVQPPFAYVIPKAFTDIAHRLFLHGFEIERLTAPLAFQGNAYRVEKIEKAEKHFQGRRLVDLHVAVESTTEQRTEPGDLIVRANPSLAPLLSYLLEPESDDGLAAWNFFKQRIRENEAYPILRLEAAVELSTEPVSREEELLHWRELTVKDIYHPEHSVEFVKPAARASWKPESDRYVIQTERGKMEVDVATGGQRKTEEEDLAPIIEALKGLPGWSREDAEKVAARGRKSPDGSARYFDHANDLFYWSPESGARRLTRDPSEERLTEMSPDGSMIAFVRDHNLHVVPVSGEGEWPITTGGGEDILMGELDWAYQEEVFGRGNFKAFWWSPDSRRLAFLRIDQSEVRSYAVTDHLSYRQDLEKTRYPKSGDPIAKASLGLASAMGGPTVWLREQPEIGAVELIVRVDWTPDSNRVVYQLQNREQTWLELRSITVEDREDKLLMRETSPAWVDPISNPHWINDETFLWLSEREGGRHLYRVSKDGADVQALTSGPWSVRQFLGVDPKEEWAYFTGTRDSAIREQGYRVRLNDGRLARITEVWNRRGRRSSERPVRSSHRLSFNDDFTYFLDTSSRLNRPAEVWARRADGKSLHCVSPVFDEPLEQYERGEPRFVEVPTRDGGSMEAALILPPNFDPNKRYPVLCYVYSGPGAQSVWDRWRGSSGLWHHMMAQHEYVIWLCDNRSASSRVGQAWPIHKQLGVQELRDLEDGLDWLTAKRWVDPDRVGIWGWSYGGYMTSYAMTHSKRFRAGVAGAPVTDWRNYDAIYTERYMGLPADNPEGYERSSAVAAADQLSGRLLLLHGTRDDNVHLANTLQLARALQKAGKSFEMMLYPDNRHGIGDSEQAYHMRRLMTEFILDNL